MRDWLVLTLAGCGLLVLALWVASIADLRDGFPSFLFGYLAMSAVYMMAVYYVLNHMNRIQHRRGLLAWTLMVAMALRVIFLFTPPVLSDDIYRYVWDGRVQKEGLNPYAYAPEASRLEHLRDPIYESINNKDLPTIYPPMMQLVLWVSTMFSETVFGMKATLVLIDAVLIGILVVLLNAAHLSPMRALIYAWSPLAIVEIAGSGHNDVLMMALLMAGHAAILRKKDTLSMCLATLSGHAKLMAFALLPFFARFTKPLAWLAVPLTSLLLILPYREVTPQSFDGLFAYGQRWRANDSLFHFLYAMTGSLDFAKLIVTAVVAALIGWLLYRRVPPLRASYLTVGAILLLSPTVHPWYILWLVPYLCFFPSPAWLALTATVALSYHAPFLAPAGEPWKELTGFKVLEYGPFLLLATWSAFSRKRDIVSAS